MTTVLRKCFSGVKGAEELRKFDKQIYCAMCIDYVHFKEGKKRLSKGEDRKVSEKSSDPAASSLNCHEISERDCGVKRCLRQM